MARAREKYNPDYPPPFNSDLMMPHEIHRFAPSLGRLTTGVTYDNTGSSGSLLYSLVCGRYAKRTALVDKGQGDAFPYATGWLSIFRAALRMHECYIDQETSGLATPYGLYPALYSEEFAKNLPGGDASCISIMWNLRTKAAQSGAISSPYLDAIPNTILYARMKMRSFFTVKDGKIQPKRSDKIISMVEDGSDLDEDYAKMAINLAKNGITSVFICQKEREFLDKFTSKFGFIAGNDIVCRSQNGSGTAIACRVFTMHGDLLGRKPGKKVTQERKKAKITPERAYGRVILPIK